MGRFSGKEKQFFEFKVLCRFIDSLQTNNSNAKLLQCYGIFWTSLNLTCIKVKTHSNLVMTQYIRGHSRKPSTLQVRDGAKTLAEVSLLKLRGLLIIFDAQFNFALGMVRIYRGFRILVCLWGVFIIYILKYVCKWLPVGTCVM